MSFLYPFLLSAGWNADVRAGAGVDILDWVLKLVAKEQPDQEPDPRLPFQCGLSDFHMRGNKLLPTPPGIADPWAEPNPKEYIPVYPTQHEWLAHWERIYISGLLVLINRKNSLAFLRRSYQILGQKTIPLIPQYLVFWREEGRNQGILWKQSQWCRLARNKMLTIGRGSVYSVTVQA